MTVNDMSKVHIDAPLVGRIASNADAALSRTDEMLVEMSRRGHCGTLREDLPAAQQRLASEGRFDGLLIKSTGIFETLPVAATFDLTGQSSERLVEVAFISPSTDRAATEQARDARHLNHTQTHQGPKGGPGCTDRPDPLPQWQCSDQAADRRR